MNRLKKIAFTLLFALVLGLVLGTILAIGQFYPSFSTMKLSLALLYLVFFVSIPLNVIIHEVGHGLAGLSQGFSFVSFRLFQWNFYIKEGRCRRSQVYIPGALGQCLMEPRSPWDKASFIPYLLGGGLLNMVSSLIFIYIAYERKDGDLWEIFFGLSLSALILGLFNLLPLDLSSIATDGKNIAIIRKSKDGKKALWSQLKVAASLAQGLGFKEIDPSLILPMEEGYGQNFLSRQQGLVYASYLANTGQVIKGDGILQQVGQGPLKGFEASLYFLAKLEIYRIKGQWDLYKDLYQKVQDRLKVLGKTTDGLYSLYIYEAYCLEDQEQAQKTWEKFLLAGEKSFYPGIIEEMIQEEKNRQRKP